MTGSTSGHRLIVVILGGPAVLGSAVLLGDPAILGSASLLGGCAVLVGAVVLGIGAPMYHLER